MMQTSSPDPSAVAAAVAALAATGVLDLNPGVPPPDVEPPRETAWSVLIAAGPAALDAIEAAMPTATGTGRIALAQIVLAIDRARGERLLDHLVHDDTAACVNTCLVGFRSVSQWARTHRPPLGQRTYRQFQQARTRGRALAWLALAGVLALLWLYASP